MTRRRILALLAAAALTVSIAALPVQAGPPETFDVPIIELFADVENGKAVFWNVTRDDFCDWAAGGFVGDAPAIELVPATINETGKGAIVASYNETRPLELWDFDDPDDLVNPCVDTDEQAGPWATGDAHIKAHDNDLDVSLTRMNAFGGNGTGTVYDADGDAWHYSWIFLAQINQDDEFRLVADDSNLKKKGN